MAIALEVCRTSSGDTPDTTAGQTRAYFVVIEGDSSAIVDLQPNQILVVGREQGCGVVLESSDVSRRHAQFQTTEQGVRVTDLRSRHGTIVNGERLTAKSNRLLRSGDRIVVGSAHLDFRCDTPMSQSFSLLSSERFLPRLHEEVRRAVFYTRELTVLSMVLPKDDVLSESLQTVLARRLRVIDFAGTDGRGELFVVVPDIKRTEVLTLVAELHREIIEVAPMLRCGVASCPEDGCDADALLSAARHYAGGNESTGVAESVVRLVNIGERPVVVCDPTMDSVYALLRRLAKSSLPVLINGETGVGKEIAASAIHGWSSRKDEMFIALNCAALPTELAESALFGHQRGAFTGAMTDKIGIFESAHGGTVFLDELGELPLSIQAKLLRVLDNQKVTRLGEVVERKIDVRLIAATNRNLQDEIRAGRFREDLFFRLSTAKVALPPLRDRPRDLTALAAQLLSEACQSNQRQLLKLSAGAKMALHSHRWPGNVRELKNAMYFVAATVEDEVTSVQAWHLPADIAGKKQNRPVDEPVAVQQSEATPVQFRPIAEEIRELESRRMLQALKACNYVQIEAAQLLSMPMRTFATKVKRYDLLRFRKG